MPVLFERREIAAAVWVPARSLGSAVRKGTIRIEFVPSDANATYQARLQWNEVTDRQREERSGASTTTTNRCEEGIRAPGTALFADDLGRIG